MDLDAIEAAEKAMATAPWRVDCCDGGSAISASNGVPITFWRHGVSDNAGIALLRNAAPEMIRRIREQDAEIKRLLELCGDAIEFVRFPMVDKITTPRGVTNRAGMLAALGNAASKGEQ